MLVYEVDPYLRSYAPAASRARGTEVRILGWVLPDIRIFQQQLPLAEISAGPNLDQDDF